MNDKISNICSIITGSVGLAYMQEVLGVCILILSVLNILVNLAIKVVTYIKTKKYKKITDAINEAKEDLEDIKEDNNNV